MNRDEFFAELDQLTPNEIEARLSSWDKEKLVLVQAYFQEREAKAAEADHLARGENGIMYNLVTDRTIAAAFIALGLVLAALILRGGYEVAGSSMGAYVVNRFTGATWQCLGTCVRLETLSQEKK